MTGAIPVDLATRHAAGPLRLKLVHIPASNLNTKIYSFVEGEACWVVSYIDAGLPAGDPSANGVATLSKGTFAFAWEAGMGTEAALVAAPGTLLGRLHGQNAAVVECKRTVVDEEAVATALSEQCLTPGNMPTNGSGAAITSGKAFASCDLL